MIPASRAVSMCARCANRRILVVSLGNPAIESDSIAYRVVESLPDLPFLRKYHLFADPLSISAVYDGEDIIVVVDVCNGNEIVVLEERDLYRVEEKGISPHVVGICSAFEILKMVYRRISMARKIFVFLPSSRVDDESVSRFLSVLMDLLKRLKKNLSTYIDPSENKQGSNQHYS